MNKNIIFLLLGIFFTIASCDSCGKKKNDTPADKMEAIFKELAEKEKPLWAEIAGLSLSKDLVAEFNPRLKTTENEFKKLDNKKDREEFVKRAQVDWNDLITSYKNKAGKIIDQVEKTGYSNTVTRFQEIINLKLKYYDRVAEVG